MLSNGEGPVEMSPLGERTRSDGKIRRASNSGLFRHVQMNLCWPNKKVELCAVFNVQFISLALFDLG